MPLLSFLVEHGKGPGNELRPTWSAICHLVRHGLVEYLEQKDQNERTAE